MINGISRIDHEGFDMVRGVKRIPK